MISILFPRLRKLYSANQLAWRLVFAVFAVGLVVTVSLTLVLLQFEYNRGLDKVKADLRTLGSSAAPQLASNLWLVNTEAIHGQLHSLRQTRVVDFIQLVENDGQIYTSGIDIKKQSNTITEVFPIAYLHPLTNKKVNLGELSLTVSLRDYKTQLFDQFLRLLLLQGLGMFVAALFFLILYHRLIARHLSHIAEYTGRLNYNLLAAPLKLSRNQHEDELQTLVNAFNQMRLNLQRGVKEREEAQRALYVEKELAEVTLISITDAIVTTTPDFKVKLLNPAAEKLLRWTQFEARDLCISDILCQGGELSADAFLAMLHHARERNKAISRQTVAIVNRRGEQFTVEYAIAPIGDQDGQVEGMVLVLHDVTESQALTEKLAYQAEHDYLTGLTNRRGFERALATAHQSALESKQKFVLMLLDLDQFKLVNDTCGHLAGDELLRLVTNLLQGLITSPEGLLGRLGGDEFGILITGEQLAEAEALAERILHALAQFRFVWQGRPHGVTVSIGLATIDEFCVSAQEAMSQADIACFAAKDGGRNRLSWYRRDDEGLQERHNELQLLATLKEAIEQNRFQLYYQKIEPFDRDLHQLPHLEILLRLIDASGRVITPGAFIPAAERYDMMAQIDCWVVEHSLNYLAECKNEGRALPQIAVNLSGKSLNNKTLIFILQQLDKTGVSPTNVCFEITETAAISNLKESTMFIETLRARGCMFSLDDFGSGFSSFNYLKTLPVDYLKIDGSLVTDIIEDKVSRQMVIAVNEIAHSLGCKTIAEFVESEDILQVLQEIGVDFAQGYHFGKPSPLK
ncbi:MULTISPECIES: EAL domain-containing protein [Deefgea]|uniref:EAL domain-containing protein n=1 Tax=Deefgea chitinilytica TaxID=570276 RepID=A0ABS2CAR2_9NEIS|nr:MULTISPECIES: EAL domain-containing protein [Deefgea]MBM5571231.1 EAL domain-containing protein [Deefgea chitinilytica]MBM9888463.1 EAL domain-containing protein [Deefgea sp. CFH1-16]